MRSLGGMYEAPFTVDKGRAALAGLNSVNITGQDQMSPKNSSEKGHLIFTVDKGRASLARVSLYVNVICQYILN